MAKRKSRRSSRSKSGGGDWKKSKPVAIGLIASICILWGYMFSDCLGGRSNITGLQDFPYTYMTEKSHTLITKRSDSNKIPTIPFTDEESGEYCWEAWVCTNEKCPNLRSKKNPEKKAYMFPQVNEYQRKVVEGEIDPNDPEAEGVPYEMGYDMTQCPKCVKGKVKEPYMVERHQTEEGKKMIKEMVDRLKKRAKK